MSLNPKQKRAMNKLRGAIEEAFKAANGEPVALNHLVSVLNSGAGSVLGSVAGAMNYSPDELHQVTLVSAQRIQTVAAEACGMAMAWQANEAKKNGGVQ